MSRPRTIAVVTVARSDYGHLRPVLTGLAAASEVALRLIVGGMHLSPVFGETVRDIERDGWTIASRVPMLDDADSPVGIARALGRGVAGFADAYGVVRPDLIVVFGDRFEMLAAASAALPFALPIAHIHGGEITTGAFDNQVRHAITKLSHLHLVAAPAHAAVVAAMGEEPWRIHVVGAPGLDRLGLTPRLSRASLAAELHLPVDEPWVLVTFHPVTLEFEETESHAEELLAALGKIDAALVITYPNADTSSRLLIERLEEFARTRERVRLVRNLGDERYLSLLEHAAVMVGNSSSGLIEAPSFGLPVVNVGSRQGGRLRGDNVIDVGYGRDEILRGVDRALAPGLRDRLRSRPNPYGDGHAAGRIVRVLRETPLDARLVRKGEVA
jgi:UDP-hydrolysing UDP-N-acetyl-D-glucosamine 2-epimerase